MQLYTYFLYIVKVDVSDNSSRMGLFHHCMYPQSYPAQSALDAILLSRQPLSSPMTNQHRIRLYDAEQIKCLRRKWTFKI